MWNGQRALRARRQGSRYGEISLWEGQMNFLDLRIHLGCQIFRSDNGYDGISRVRFEGHQVCTYENEGCCLPRISFKYGSLLDLLRGSERGSWTHRSNTFHVLRDDGPCAASTLYHCALLAQHHARGNQTRYRTRQLAVPGSFHNCHCA